jgi:hypothetical protein
MNSHGIVMTIAVGGLMAWGLMALSAARADAAPKQRTPYAASRAYDGLWSVSVHTAYGPCDPTYRYPARIVGGRVLQADNDFSYRISGAVVASGAIDVTVYRGGQSATGYGRLHGSSGSGRWSTGGNTCYGTWSAMRRAAN